jgi:adenosine deaminase
MNRMENIDKIVEKIPKVELHIHLEGSIPIETLFEFIQRDGNESLIKSISDLRDKLKYKDFPHFIELWIWKNKFIKSERDFETITYQVLKELDKQNVKYAEIFYSPGDYDKYGFSAKLITENIIKARNKAHKDFGIRSEFIVDVIRDLDADEGLKKIEELKEYLGKGLIGVGLGGSEHNFPAKRHKEVYKRAKELGYRLVAHAGEADGAESIWDSINSLNTERIGHGVRANEDPELVSYLKEKQIPLEVCPISNVKTGVYNSIKEHPVKEYFDKGLMITINSDDPVMFNTSINKEYITLYNELDFSLKDLKKISMSGIEASFLSNIEKEEMKTIFEKEWNDIL